jgi:hypothetical protein
VVSSQSLARLCPTAAYVKTVSDRTRRWVSVNEGIVSSKVEPGSDWNSMFNNTSEANGNEDLVHTDSLIRSFGFSIAAVEIEAVRTQGCPRDSTPAEVGWKARGLRWEGKHRA